VDAVDGDRLLVSGSGAAELNAALVDAGVRVTGLASERRTLEDAVLELTGDGSDRRAS
jgi:ABC-2 type transport system ATP-binding protein